MSTPRIVVPTILFLLVASVAMAHDLFLKLDTYFLEPHTRVQIPVLNGTFTKSENFIARDRLADISVVSPRGRAKLVPAAAWSPGPDSTSLLSLELGDAGTYVAGASTRRREISLTAEQFNAYLEEDGLPDVLDARRAAKELGRDARERYSKHVKAVFQVGDAPGAGFDVVLGYPAEIVALENPYASGRGPSLRVRCLVDGRPVANQVVLWGGPGAERTTRTDSLGVVQVTLDAAGKWYVKFVHMERANRPGLDYESKWATLTFETR
ncbi:MAG TPA: DUF4198 domain-containing protein [Gemmatimonadales bacterium]|nr:DUF4198 domain-containing protein [Gemmatimonadales bacterium]